MFKPFQQSRSVVTYFEKNKIDPYGTSITTDNTHDALLSIFTDSSEICDFYQSNYLLRSKTQQCRDSLEKCSVDEHRILQKSPQKCRNQSKDEYKDFSQQLICMEKTLRERINEKISSKKKSGIKGILGELRVRDIVCSGKEATFRPCTIQVNLFHDKKLTVKHPCHSVRPSQIQFEARQQRLLVKRQQTVNALRIEQENISTKQCTFKPKLTPFRHKLYQPNEVVQHNKPSINRSQRVSSLR